MNMNFPKLLPWLARQAGMTEAHVEALWNKALRDSGTPGSSLTQAQRAALAMRELVAMLVPGRSTGQATQSRPGRNASANGLLLADNLRRAA